VGAFNTFIPLPEDFAQFAHLPNTPIQEHYGVSRRIVARWRKETGLYATRRAPPKRVYPAPLTHRIAADISIAGRAAEHLRRRGYIPVCKLITIDRKADANLWLVGARKLASGEMIDLAEARGFDPNEWARLSHVA